VSQNEEVKIWSPYCKHILDQMYCIFRSLGFWTVSCSSSDLQGHSRQWCRV